MAVDAKLDGIRIQVHRDGDDVLVVTRSLDDITARLPEVVEVARSLPATSFVLDGEALALGDDGRPRPFQETASRTAMTEGVAVTPYFFDVLHLDGDDLLDAPRPRERRRSSGWCRTSTGCRGWSPPRPPRPRPSSTRRSARATRASWSRRSTAPYDAGRRGAAWVKVKPVHTLDLVVLAVEWGSGRREGWLSNIHLGARDPSLGRAS